MGKGVEKLEKGEIFTVIGGTNMILEKGGGAKISHFWEIYTPATVINIFSISMARTLCAVMDVNIPYKRFPPTC